jgi:hypothetical protein
MTSKERILRHLAGKEVDRIPMLGGWNLGVDTICTLAGIDRQEYLQDPYGAVVRANLNLGVDALVNPVIPEPADELRNGSLKQEDFRLVEPEALLEAAGRIPSTEAAILASIDRRAIEEQLRQRYAPGRHRLGTMEHVVTEWEGIADFSLYFTYGYEAFLAAVALYPDAVEALYWRSGIITRERNKILVDLVKEFDLLPMVFTGCDICLGTGPMCSPEFLRRRYWPHARHSMQPLVDAGIRVVCHCDGNVMPLVDDFLDAGFTGFQGFQYEFGVDPFVMRRKALDRDIVPLWFAGLSVTRTLPSGSLDDVRREVEYMMDVSAGGQGLFLFTSNVTGIDVPPENLMAAYAHQARLPKGWTSGHADRVWPNAHVGMGS